MVRQLNHNEIRALHDELKLKDILTTAERLPPFPDIVWKVMSLLRKTAPIKEIEAVIKYDQAITAKVLALSQSVYYSRRQKVASLHDAIMVLGSQKLIQVIMTSSAIRYFEKSTNRGDANEWELWQHSVAAALMGEMVAVHLKHKKVLSIYTAALLHDIGKTVLDSYARIYLGCTLNRMKERGLQLLATERAALGIDHQDLGEKIARRWKFPDEVTVGIGYHHYPHQATACKDIAAIVYVADRLSISIEPGQEGRNALEPERDPIFRGFGLNATICLEFQARLETALDGVKQFLVSVD
ncbi:MAG: HDOD domain-containing protein [Syntrophobacteraceae bacterium]